MADCPENDEEYFDVRAQKKEGKGILRIEASGDIGFIYGIYHISRKFLGVQPFWFWNEQTFFKRESYKYPDLFRGLWKKAIENQKDCKVVWNLMSH